MNSPTTLIKKIDFENLIEDLKRASMVRDFQIFEDRILPYAETGLSEFSIYERAHLNYFLGYYFIHAGKSKNVKEFQEKGRDFLTNAITLFNSIGYRDEAIEAQSSLGWSYYQTGEIENYENWLLDALYQCTDKRSDVYFSIQVSLLIHYFDKSKIDEALILINGIQKNGLCQNERIRWQYFQNSSRIFRISRKYQKAFQFHSQAIQIAQEIENKHFEGLSLNSLAHTYFDSGNHFQAFEVIDQALEIFKSINNNGAIACALDSKASFYYESADYGSALNTINSSLTYFRLGESYREFVWALWIKIEICVKLHKKIEIFETFRELSDVSGNHLGIDKQRKYYEKFQKIALIPFGDNFQEKIDTCEKEIIIPVLESSETITDASRRLGFRTHHNLSNLLKRHNLSNPTARADKADIIPTKRLNINIPLSLRVAAISFYEVSEKVSQSLGYNCEIILVIINKNDFCEDDLVLVKTNDGLVVTMVAFEHNNHFFVELNGNTRNKGKWVGRICGIVKKATNEFIQI